MNTTQLTQYYGNTLIKEYVTQPNAYSTAQLLAYIALMPQDGGVVYNPGDGSVVTNVDGSPVTVLDPDAAPILPLAIIPAFDIATAVGQQLEFIAEGIGAVNSGLNLSGQFVTLNDTNYRLLLQAVQGRNFMVATTESIQAFIALFFSGILRVKDELNMRMSYQLLVPIGSLPWVELFITQGFLPRPLGVEMSLSINPVSFFGCISYLEPIPNAWVKPACTYSAPVTSSTPVLLYSDGIQP